MQTAPAPWQARSLIHHQKTSDLECEWDGTPVTFRTGKLALLIVAAPARRRVALAARGAYLDYVCARLVIRHVDALMTAVAARGFSVAAVLEIIEAQRGERTLCKFQGSFRVRVTDAALAELLCRLMRVTTITLLMSWEC